jgi:hypothetical protein
LGLVPWDKSHGYRQESLRDLQQTQIPCLAIHSVAVRGKPINQDGTAFISFLPRALARLLRTILVVVGISAGVFAGGTGSGHWSMAGVEMQIFFCAK